MFSWRIDLQEYCRILEAGEAAKGIGVFQVEGRLLISELSVLLQHGAPQHLL
jgi:hypothetical protein